MIKRILLMETHAQASAVESAIKSRILQLNEQAHKRDLSDKERNERSLLNEAYERMSSCGKTIPSSVTPSTWNEWLESEETSQLL
ncbi:hypothetical protein [Numidum massiliense]|uniref:hypothetical protein n=1 Tax=Numidum massiliense TaxID=1522315 RepID=UPI0006D555C1|nr:hypothetical protein [Numidum massiliense]